MKRLMFVVFALLSASTAYGNDYPTVDRVEYVQECMRDSPGARYEMIYKCSCAIDAISKEMPYDEFVEASTASNASSIAGERGNYIRDAQVAKDLTTKFRTAQAKAKKGCFIN